MNDGRCFPGHQTPEDERLRKERKNNIQFYQTESPVTVISSRACKLLAVRALQNVKYDGALFVDYGNSQLCN